MGDQFEFMQLEKIFIIIDSSINKIKKIEKNYRKNCMILKIEY